MAGGGEGPEGEERRIGQEIAGVAFLEQNALSNR